MSQRYTTWEVTMAEKGAITVKEGAGRGGTSTKKKYGGDFYKAIRKKGGETTKERHGHEHYEKIGRKGGQQMRGLIASAKKAMAQKKKVSAGPAGEQTKKRNQTHGIRESGPAP